MDNDRLATELDVRGAAACIPQASRKDQRVYHKEACKWRHPMENVFARIKEYRGSATPHDKTDSNDAANWNLAATLLASRSTLLSTGAGAASAA